MPRHYRVQPIRRPGKRAYSATFYDASGKRVTRGLGTDSASTARVVCEGLVCLHERKIRSVSEVPPEVSLKSVELYFAEPFRPPESAAANASEVENIMLHVNEELRRYPPEVSAVMFPVLIDRARLHGENAKQRVQIAKLGRELQEKKDRIEQMESSVIVRAAEAAGKAPSAADALFQYTAHIHASTTKNNARDHVALAKAFLETVPDLGNIAAVMPDHVSRFLDARASRGDETRKAGRRRAARVNLGRFLNWAARNWGYPSPMLAVPSVTKSQVLRERGDIHWHTLDEVEQAIEAIPQRLALRWDHKTGAFVQREAGAGAADVAYWRALVAMLGYAGLQLAELAWLRVSDLEFMQDRGKVWITTVEDPEDPAERHSIKTHHRRREVDLHPVHLLPRLKAHLAAGNAGKTYLFPLPPVRRRRIRGVAGGSSERWLVQGLSGALRGHPGGKDKRKRPPTAGILSGDMNAKSLRRTFGSLLLRSGRSAAEVAAIMGNTESVVREHYARILGSEVRVNF